MNRNLKTATLGLMAVAMAGVIALVSPQLMASQSSTVDTSVPAGTVAAKPAQSQSDLVDAYSWRTTISYSKNPRF